LTKAGMVFLLALCGVGIIAALAVSRHIDGLLFLVRQWRG